MCPLVVPNHVEMQWTLAIVSLNWTDPNWWFHEYFMVSEHFRKIINAIRLKCQKSRSIFLENVCGFAAKWSVKCTKTYAKCKRFKEIASEKWWVCAKLLRALISYSIEYHKESCKVIPWKLCVCVLTKMIVAIRRKAHNS